MPEVLHVTTGAAWDAAVAADRPYRHESLDTEGFVHCSSDEQLPGTLDRYFADDDRAALVALVVDTERLRRHGVDVRWETATGDDRFPHVYGPIPLDAVVDVRPLG